jgi:molybdopterin synthase sulfur carrier subunit
MASVRLDGMLRQFIPTLTVESSAGSVERVLDELEARYPRMQRRLRDETGALRKFVHVFVNGQDIGALAGLQTRLHATDHVDILHSIQGG